MTCRCEKAYIQGRLPGARCLASEMTDTVEDMAITTCMRCSQAYENVRNMMPCKRVLGHLTLLWNVGRHDGRFARTLM